ncbi:hypothetical protein KCU81_g554, partial [Aureobasidium melanogenum]
MDWLPCSDPSSGVAASSSTSFSASSPATTATSSRLVDTLGPSQHEQPVLVPETFSDPFTGVPSAPSDVSRLFMLCQCETRPCPLSVPGTKNKSLKVREEWLFSGGAPPSLAKLHRNADGSTSVSFSAKVRACVYVLRLYSQRRYPLYRACNQIASIFGQETSFQVSQESWQNVVIRTEPPEIPSDVWTHAYPTPAIPRPSSPVDQRDSTTLVQTQHFRGAASIQSSEPDDVPNGWTLWTPVTEPTLQRFARHRAYSYQSKRGYEIVHSSVAMPMHEIGIYRAANARQMSGQSTRFSSPDVLAGAEEGYEVEARSNATDPAQDPRHQLIKRLSQTPQTGTPSPEDLAATKRGNARSRQPSTPAPTKAITRPTRIRLIAPQRPSTPEQIAAFEEAMETHSPTNTYDDAFSEPQVQGTGDSPESSSSSSSSEASYQLSMTKMSMAKDRLRDAGLGIDGIGMKDLAEERVSSSDLANEVSSLRSINADCLHTLYLKASWKVAGLLIKAQTRAQEVSLGLLLTFSLMRAGILKWYSYDGQQVSAYSILQAGCIEDLPGCVSQVERFEVRGDLKEPISMFSLVLGQESQALAVMTLAAFKGTRDLAHDFRERGFATDEGQVCDEIDTKTRSCMRYMLERPGFCFRVRVCGDVRSYGVKKSKEIIDLYSLDVTGDASSFC